MLQYTRRRTPPSPHTSPPVPRHPRCTTAARRFPAPANPLPRPAVTALTIWAGDDPVTARAEKHVRSLFKKIAPPITIPGPDTLFRKTPAKSPPHILSAG